eukprot:3941134-Rhodomonas_salina.3
MPASPRKSRQYVMTAGRSPRSHGRGDSATWTVNSGPVTVASGTTTPAPQASWPCRAVWLSQT